jgi:hypothetical protein
VNASQKELVRQHKALRRLTKLGSWTIAPLDADYHFAIKQWRLDKQNNQFWSRTLFRCLCANIEARLYMFRREAIGMVAVSKETFSKEETEILTEVRTVLVNGVATTRPKWLPIRDAFKESFRLFAKAVGLAFEVDSGTEGFAALCETFEVRHRLMHPKSVFDVEVREDHMV